MCRVKIFDFWGVSLESFCGMAIGENVEDYLRDQREPKVKEGEVVGRRMTIW